MTSRHSLLLALGSLLAGSAASLPAQTLLDLNFDADTVGGQATGVTMVTPVAPGNPATPYGALASGNTGSLVISSTDNPIGTGQALRIFDNSTFNSAIARLTIPLSGGSSAVAIGFDFRAGPSVTLDGNSYLRFSWGGASVNAASSTVTLDTGNFSRVAFSGANNTSGFTVANTTATSMTDANQFNPAENATNSVRIYVNRGAAPLLYTGPDSNGYSIASNSFQVWVNGVQRVAGASSGNFAMAPGATDISYLSFGTGGSQVTPDWVIDNLLVTSISSVPEPSSCASILGGAALTGVVGLRRRRPAR